MENQEELIERYLSNKLDRDEMSSFQVELRQSKDLRQEVIRQRHLVKGLENARKQELKSMLNNIPTGSIWSDTFSQAGLAMVSVGLVSTVLYFSVRNKEQKPQLIEQNAETLDQRSAHFHQASSSLDTIISLPSGQSITPETERLTSPASTNKTANIQRASTQQNHAKLSPPPVPPSRSIEDVNHKLEPAYQASFSQENDEPSAFLIDPLATNTPLEVELHEAKTDYSFHYHFMGNKLILYGPFTANTYELLEGENTDQTLYLHYKSDYYPLDRQQKTASPLIRITDPNLIQTLDSIQGL